MDRGSRNFLAQNPDWVSKFETTAEPTTLTASQLQFFGHRRYRQVIFVVRCQEYQACTVFFDLYFKPWWIALGQTCNILESFNGKSVPGSRTILKLTYNLSEPIFFHHISDEPLFKIYSPPTKYCFEHDLFDGQPMNLVEGFVHDTSVNCASKAERLTFEFRLVGMDA
jgi:hypothetical protein